MLVSVWKRLACFGDANAVIGEFEMGTGELYLGHVTRNAQALRDWAGLRGSPFLSFGFGRGSGLQALA